MKKNVVQIIDDKFIYIDNRFYPVDELGEDHSYIDENSVLIVKRRIIFNAYIKCKKTGIISQFNTFNTILPEEYEIIQINDYINSNKTADLLTKKKDNNTYFQYENKVYCYNSEEDTICLSEFYKFIDGVLRFVIDDGVYTDSTGQDYLVYNSNMYIISLDDFINPCKVHKISPEEYSDIDWYYFEKIDSTFEEVREGIVDNLKKAEQEYDHYKEKVSDLRASLALMNVIK